MVNKWIFFCFPPQWLFLHHFGPVFLTEMKSLTSRNEYLLNDELALRKLGNRHSLVGALGWQAREGPSIIPRLCTFTIWKQGGWQEFYYAGAPFGNNDIIQCYLAQNMGGAPLFTQRDKKRLKVFCFDFAFFRKFFGTFALSHHSTFYKK